MTQNPRRRRLATEYGFRTTDTAAFAKFVTDHKLTVPASIIDVIESLTYQALEAMITRIEAAYAGQSGGSVVPSAGGPSTASSAPPSAAP